MRQILSATQIHEWFSSTRRDAQELLPHMVRRLIWATGGREAIKSMRIPVGDQVHQPGYDGRVETTAECFNVPRGLSVWEMGTGEPSDKASKDIRKRTDDPRGIDPSTTEFVFVSPHFWDRKDQWVEKWRVESPWASVRGLDVTDLETWLEAYPPVARWLAGQMGVPVAGIRDIDSYFDEEFNARYGLLIPPQLVIAGRDDAVTKLREWIDSDSPRITVAGESVEEAAGFVSASVMSLQADDRERVSSSLLAVDCPAPLGSVQERC